VAQELLSFLILISAGLFLSELFRRFHLPYVVALIATGIIIGPYFLDIFEPTQTTDFIGSVGLIFLMFMAGIEIRLSSLAKFKSKIAKISILNGSIPFLVGFGIALYFGYGIVAAIMLGIIFISSSIAVVIPSLEAMGLMNKKLGKVIVGSTMFEDVTSLVLLSVALQTINPTTDMPLIIFYPLVFISMLALKFIIPRLRWFLFQKSRKDKDLFEQDLRLVFATLIAVVIIFDLLGMHAIIAGFFAGLVLSESIKSELLRKKLHAISYGLFIPAFFIIIGTEMELSVFGNIGDAALLAVAIIAGSVLSKLVSGYFGGRLAGFGKAQSRLIGASTIPQLSTTLAVAFVGLETGIIDQRIVTIMILLSAVTTVLAPLLISWAKKDLAEGRNIGHREIKEQIDRTI